MDTMSLFEIKMSHKDISLQGFLKANISTKAKRTFCALYFGKFLHALSLKKPMFMRGEKNDNEKGKEREKCRQIRIDSGSRAGMANYQCNHTNYRLCVCFVPKRTCVQFQHRDLSRLEERQRGPACHLQPNTETPLLSPEVTALSLRQTDVGTLYAFCNSKGVNHARPQFSTYSETRRKTEQAVEHKHTSSLSLVSVNHTQTDDQL